MKALIKDKNVMDKEVTNTVKDHKRKHDDDEEDNDKDPPAGLNQGKKTKRRRPKESESSKKPSSTKETPKGKAPTKGSKTSMFASAKELVKEPITKVVIDDAGDDQPPRPPTPDPEWNKHQVILDQPIQTWFTQMVSTSKDPITFNDLMATPIDFSKSNQQQQFDDLGDFVKEESWIDETGNDILRDCPNQAFLLNHWSILGFGPVYNLLKRTCTSSIELEYNIKECFKALINRLDWNNPEGDHCPFELKKPILLKGRSGHLTVAAEYFFNNDLEFLKSFDLEKNVPDQVEFRDTRERINFGPGAFTLTTNALFQANRVKVYDLDCDDVPNAQPSYMANISSYGSDALAEVHNPDNVDNNMINQESQQTAVQNYNSSAQQDALILSVIEQLKSHKAQELEPKLYDDPSPSYRPTKLEVLKELLKVSMVNTSLKKLKHHLVSFNVVVKERTTDTAITKGLWRFEHTKACFRDEIIPFVKALKDLFNTFDQYLIDELSEVQHVFHQMEQAVEQYHLESKTFDVKMNKVLNENERLLEQVMNKDIVNTIMNSTVDNASVNVHECETVSNSRLSFSTKRT
uniref:Uncharacterized protein n=1 Tax=Tanacetum cinerariifolium TaxID=118510 RepID=A0A6L2JCX7_TANCI|nr:hypothetical protein [Tanacetum cinerariifolium]